MKKKAETRILRYGDKILMASSKQRFYLGSRGRSNGYYAQCQFDFLMEEYLLYPNVEEVTFEIHPVLNFEALQEFNESSINDPNKQMYYTRKVNEEGLNKARVSDFHGKPVKLGSLIQIYHPNTKTYLSFNSQKIKHTDLGIVGSSTEISESIQFIIRSPFEFVKEGSLISYEDTFVIADKWKNTLAYPTIQEDIQKLELKLKEKKADKPGPNNEPSHQGQKSPSHLESLALYKGFHAGYTSLSNIGKSYSNQFEAIPAQWVPKDNAAKVEIDPNDINYEDVVCIRRLDNSGKTSAVSADVNKSSLRNVVYYRTMNEEANSKQMFLESQFKIIKVSLRYAEPHITFGKLNCIAVMFKHVVSGRFLGIDPGTRKLVLGGDYLEELPGLKSRRSEINRLFQEKQEQYRRAEDLKKNEELTKKDIPYLNDYEVDLIHITGPGDLIKTDSDFFTAYVLLHSFVLEKISTDDNLKLRNSTFFKIRTFANGYLKTDQDQAYIQALTEQAIKEENSANFQVNFYANAEKAKCMSQETVIESNQSSDLFRIEAVNKNISDYFYRNNSLTSTLLRIMGSKDLTQPRILDYIDAIDNIFQKYNEAKTEGKIDRRALQLALLNGGQLDQLMDYLIKVKNMKDQENQMSLLVESCSTTISHLIEACDQNDLVCHYLFQWRNFFTQTIVKNDNQVFKKLNLDFLLFKIVGVLKCYSVYIDDLLLGICSTMDYRSLDLKKLERLIQIINNMRDLNDTQSLQQVFQKIFEQGPKHEIFKKLCVDEQKNLYIEILPGKRTLINTTLEKTDYETYVYFIRTLTLAVSLSELDVVYSSTYLREFFAKDILKIVLVDSKMQVSVRSSCIQLFSNIYIISSYASGIDIKYESLITSSVGEVDTSVKLKGRMLQKYEENLDDEQFLGDQVEELINSNSSLAFDSIKIFKVLISNEFFDMDSMEEIMENFVTIIQNQQGLDVRSFKGEKNLESRKNVVDTNRTETLNEMLEIMIDINSKIMRKMVHEAVKNRSQKQIKPFRPFEEAEDQRGKGPEKSVNQLLVQYYVDNDKGFEGFKKKWMEEKGINEKISGWIMGSEHKLAVQIIRYLQMMHSFKYEYAKYQTEFYRIDDPAPHAIYNLLSPNIQGLFSNLREVAFEYQITDVTTVFSRSDFYLAELQKLFGHFFSVMDDDDRRTKIEKLIGDYRQYRVKKIEDINNSTAFQNVLNIFLMGIRNLPTKQSIILKSGLLEILMKTMRSYNDNLFLRLPELAVRKVETSSFNSIMEWSGDQPYKEEINMLLTLLLYYSCLGNSEVNKELMKNYTQELHQFILMCLRSSNDILKKATLSLVIELYKDNLKHLTMLRNKKAWFIDSLLDLFEKEILAKNFAILCNYVEVFETLSFFNYAIMEENAKKIITRLFSDSIPSQLTISAQGLKVKEDLEKRYGNQNLAEELDFSKSKKGAIFRNDVKEIDEMDERNNIYNAMIYDDKIFFLNSVYRLMGLYGQNCSLEFKYKLQKLLSMSDILDLLKVCNFTYFFKENLLIVLSNIFITSKIDQNSRNNILEFISSILVPDIKSCLRMKSNNFNLKEIFFINYNTSVSHLLFEYEEKQASTNIFVVQYTESFNNYIGKAILPFIDRFAIVCANESIFNILESLQILVSEIKTVETEVMVLLKDAYNEGVTGSKMENGLFSTLIKNEDEERKRKREDDTKDMVKYAGELRNKLMSLGKHFPKDSKVDLIENSKIQCRKYMQKAMKNAYLSEKLYDDEQSQLDFFEYLTTMMMYQEAREEEPKPPKIEKMESLLSDSPQKKVNFFKGLGLKKEPSGEAGAPVLTLGDKAVKAELYQEKNKNSASDGTGMVKVLSQPVSEEHVRAENRHIVKVKDEDFFISFISQIIKLMEVTRHADFGIMIIKYLSHLLKTADKDFNARILKVFREVNIVKNLAQLALTNKENFDFFATALRLLNEILQADHTFQKDILLFLKEENDNKFLNNYALVLDQVFNSFLELESLKRQFEEYRKHPILKKVKLTEFEFRLFEECQGVMINITRLLETLQSLSRMHFKEGQNYLREQIVNQLSKPNQVNFLMLLTEHFKNYLKYTSDRNFKVGMAILKSYISLIGNNKKNQNQMVYHKVISLVEDLYTSVNLDDQITENSEQTIISSLCIELNLATLESTTDPMIVKSLALNFKPERIWRRIFQLHSYLTYEKRAPISDSISSKALAFQLDLFDTDTHVTGADTFHPRAIFVENIFGDKIEMRARKNVQAQVGDLMGPAIQTKGTIEAVNEYSGAISTMFGETKFEEKAAPAVKAHRVMNGEEYSSLTLEALRSYLWINTISDTDPRIDKQNDELVMYYKSKSKTHRKALEFLENRVNQIEIMDENKELQTVYYIIDPRSQYLNKYTKETFENTVVRTTTITKLEGLIAEIPDFLEEINHFLMLKKRLGFRINLDYLFVLRLINFLNAVFLNIFLLIYSDRPSPIRSPRLYPVLPDTYDRWDNTMIIFSFFNLFIYLVLLICFFTFNFTIQLQGFRKTVLEEIRKMREKEEKGQKKTGKNKSMMKSLLEAYQYNRMIIGLFLTKTELFALLLFISCNIFGITSNKFYFSVLLFEIISIVKMLGVVVSSVIFNLKSLGITFLFAVILHYMFAAFAYFYQDNLAVNEGTINHKNARFCQNLPLCLVNMIYHGIRVGGGLGTSLKKPPIQSRLSELLGVQLFCMVFWVFLCLLLLPVILGLLTNSFADLREKRELNGKVPLNPRERQSNRLFHLWTHESGLHNSESFLRQAQRELALDLELFQLYLWHPSEIRFRTHWNRIEDKSLVQKERHHLVPYRQDAAHERVADGRGSLSGSEVDRIRAVV
jgi:hypothetical protein